MEGFANALFFKTKKGLSIERPFGIFLARLIGWEAI
jgi:hypothetical protein